MLLAAERCPVRARLVNDDAGCGRAAPGRGSVSRAKRATTVRAGHPELALSTSSTRVTPSLVRAGGALDPVLKWPGGKRQERAGLLASWPRRASRYLEPFVGGGAMWLATDPAVPAAINDASDDLVAVYRAATDVDRRVFQALDDLAAWWSSVAGMDVVVRDLAVLHPADPAPRAEVAALVSRHADLLTAATPPELVATHLDDLLRTVPRKLARMRRVELDRGVDLPGEDVLANVEGSLRAAVYTTIRSTYNAERGAGRRSPMRTAAFVVLRELAYAAMFRFNNDGDFNVPYGGLSYNDKDLARVADALRAPDFLDRLATTEVHGTDFAVFAERVAPEPDDFVFLDPPYLSDFRDYDGRGFGPADHRRLAGMLRELPSRFQLVVKATPEVRDWYGRGDWTVRESDKTYAWTIKSRNDRRATHLVIENA